MGFFSLSTFSPLPGVGEQFKGATFKMNLNTVKPIALKGRHTLQGLLSRSRFRYMSEAQGVWGFFLV